jgi:hypothetical protein
MRRSAADQLSGGNGGGTGIPGIAARGAGQRSSRRKRKRPRGQRTPERQNTPAASTSGSDGNGRESIFQDVEGLLRRIREHAEETGLWSEDHLIEITHMVTAFTRTLEGEGDPVPDRVRSEYHWVREKLAQALRGMQQEATP